MSVRKKAAVIGLGHQALEDHVPGLADSQFAQLAAVCDTDPDKAAAQAQRHNVPGFTDIRTLLDDVRPDFVIVAVPHHAGREVIEACAASGVHVMKEKPFATSPAEAAELAALCDKAGIELMVTVQRRFHPTSSTPPTPTASPSTSSAPSSLTRRAGYCCCTALPTTTSAACGNSPPAASTRARP